MANGRPSFTALQTLAPILREIRAHFVPVPKDS
jgi:hypothetical protein